MSATKRLLQDRFKSKPSSTPGGKGEKKLTDYFARKPTDASAPAWSQSSSQPPSTPDNITIMTRGQKTTGNNKRDGQSATGGARGGYKPRASGRSQSTKQPPLPPSVSTSTRPDIIAPIASIPISRTISSSSTAHSSSISRSASRFDGVEIVSPPHITKMHKKVIARTAAKDKNAQVMLPSKRKLEDDAENATPRPRRRQGRSIAKTSTPAKKPPRGAKKPRLSPPAENDADGIELVPSSQSDEHELCVPRPLASKDLGAVRESVEVWRRDADADVSVPVFDAQEDLTSVLFASSPLTSPSSPFTAPTAAPPTSRPSSPPTMPALATSPLTEPTDTGLPSPTSPSQPTRVSLPPSSPLSTPAPTSDFDVDMDMTLKLISRPASPSTPPPTSPAQEHAPTPDAKTRTAALVARIRAEAMREVMSSPEPEAARYDDLDDLELGSSDDDEVSGWPAIKKPTAKMSKAAPAPARRYGLRARGRDALPTPAQSSPDPDPAPVPAVRGRKEAKRKRANADPIEAMLREKNDAERKGSSGAALRRAEGEGVDLDALLRAPADEEDEEDDDKKGASWGDEEAARRAARRGMEMREGAGGEGAGVEEARAEDGVRLLEPGERQAVGRILSGDKSGGSGVGKKREVGVRVWVEAEEGEGMDVDGERALPALEGEDDGGVVTMLRGLIKRNDTVKIKLLLDTGFLRSADANSLSNIVHWLIKLALPDTSTPLSVSAFNALRNLPLSLPSASVSSPLPPARLISILAHLGLKPELLQYVGEVSEPSSSVTVDGVARNEALYRLVALVPVFARAQWFEAADIPHIVMALLLVGIDTKASEDLRRDVLVAIELACAALPAAGTTTDKPESATAGLVLRYASTLSVQNQSRLLALFARGCPQALRIARFVAFGLLTGTDLSKESYTPLPPLTSLVGVLDADEGLFDVGADDTDYDALGARVDVLGVALSGIVGYVIAEGRPVPAIADDSSPRKGRERPPLELVKNRLDVLHGKIVDTRAVNLDRSRVKAALQRLAMRIFYQRAAVQSAGPKSLFDHWGRSRPSMD